MVATGTDAALELFNAKQANVLRVCEFRADKHRLPPDAREEVQQNALMHLWQQCLKLAHRPDAGRIINAKISALAGWAAFKRGRRWGRETDGTWPRAFTDMTQEGHGGREIIFDAAAPGGGIDVEGVRVTMADARIDHPRELAVVETGITSTELARRLGVTKQAIHARRYELGGVQLPGTKGRWRYPANAG